MDIIANNSQDICIKHGETLTITTDGKALVFRYVGGLLTGDVLEATPISPVSVGPLFIASQWRISSLIGTATYTKDTTGQICRVIKTTDAEIPTYGKTGLIYETESGWVRWDDTTDTYVKPSLSTKRGWERIDTDTMGDITWTEATRTFSISPKTGQTSFHFWSGGIKFTKTITEELIIPDVGGTYYVYYDRSGVLQSVLNESFSADDFLTVAISGLCYYNKTEGTITYSSDEQHGVTMASTTHLRLHFVDGYSYVQGALINGLVDGSATYTNISVGLFADEDINIMTSLSAAHPFIYRDGALGEWRETTPDNNCGHTVSGDTYNSWNENTSGTIWQLTECTNSTDYVIMFFIATNFTPNPIRKIIGQQTYSSRSNARDGIKNELTALDLEGLPSSETSYLYAYICTRSGEVEDDGDGNNYVDLRKTKGYYLPD